MVDEFLNNLISSNKTYSYFVDWEKGRNYRDKYKDELALLQVLSHEGVNPKVELKRLLVTYPRLNSLIPLLAAIRVKPNTPIVVVDENSIGNKGFSFEPRGLSNININETIEFADRIGLLRELMTIKNHSDYYFGVEVGLDTNARKNRSGEAMERLVETYVRELVHQHDGTFLKQKNFSFAAKLFGVKAPTHQENKKGDFMIFIDLKPYNIETNYFDGSGSKQEIMNSYISRAEDLAKDGWGFALVTDGKGWLQNRRQIEEGYARIVNVFNVKMCQEGKLENIL